LYFLSKPSIGRRNYSRLKNKNPHLQSVNGNNHRCHHQHHQCHHHYKLEKNKVASNSDIVRASANNNDVQIDEVASGEAIVEIRS
jgi:hypothetical protein